MREFYYDIKEKYNSTVGFLFIDSDAITSLIDKNLNDIPKGYDGWIESKTVRLIQSASSTKCRKRRNLLRQF